MRRAGFALVLSLASSKVGAVNEMRTLHPGDSLADAIAAAPEGATLVLAPGTYSVNVVLPHSLTLKGSGGEVMLDGGGRGSIVRVAGSDKSIRLESLTLTNGGGQGAAISGHGMSSIELVDVIVRRNHAARAAVIQVDAGTLHLERCQIESNSGDFGGALLVGGVAHATLVHTTIANNQATTSAVAVQDLGQLLIDRSTIRGAGAPVAIEMRGTPGRLPELVIRDSTVENEGKVAIANGPRLPGTVTVERTTIDGETTGVITKR